MATADKISGEIEMMCSPNPALKIVWIIMGVALRSKSTVITFLKKNGESAIKLDHAGDIIPPERELFSKILQLLHCIGDKAKENPQSSFTYSYAKTEGEEKLEWRIKYNDQDCAEELHQLLEPINERTKEQMAARQDYWRKEKIRRRAISIGSGTALLLIILYFLFYLLW